MAQQEKPIIKKPPPYSPTKFLLSSINTFFGNLLVLRLRNQHAHPENPNRILGTLSTVQPDSPVPEGVRKVIDTGKVKFFEEIILNSDVIIYDLNTCDLKEAQFVISTLKLHNFSEEKILICISNVMTWAKTKPKQKKQGQQQQGDDNPPQEGDTEVEGDAGGDGQQKKVYVRFQDKDYSLRKPDPSYQKIKSIETLCMSAGKVKPNLKTYIICSGILYGEGERLLAPYFMQARLQNPQQLKYYGNGKNRIPMIHIQDLITFVEKTFEKKPKLPYILAVDHNPKPTQKRIIQSISQGVGTGKIKSEVVGQMTQTKKMLTLNLRIRPTMFFQKLQQQQAAIQQEEGNEIPKFTFKWHYKDGIQKSIKRLCDQFNKCRGLKQTKIFITGPPGSGKTYYSKQLSVKYNLPHIHIKGVINQIKNLPGEFGDEIRNYLTEKKQEQIGEIQAKLEQEKEKQKKIPKDLREPLEPFNPDTYEVRLSDELVYKCYKWRLSQNDCLNRGYILDSFPRKYEDALELFMGLPPVEQGQEPEQNPKKIIQQRAIPDKVIILQMSDKQILKRIQHLDEQYVTGTHLNEKATKRRLKIYRKLMDTSTGEYVLQDFFKQNKVQIFHVGQSSQTSNALESIIKPLPLQQSQYQEAIKKKLQKEAEMRKKQREDMDSKHNIIRNIQNEDYMMKKENEQNEERDILDKNSLALRKYLDSNVVPILSEGIVKILTQFPQDPVDFLAQFLFQNCLNVPNPDPSTFQF